MSTILLQTTIPEHPDDWDISRFSLLADELRAAGHDVIAREIYVSEVAASTAREQPDVALVGLGLHGRLPPGVAEHTAKLAVAPEAMTRVRAS